MKTELMTLKPDTLWKVFCRDAGAWRAGLYRPDATDPDRIESLERHSCPELFICLGGRMGLVLKDDAEERIAEFEPNQAMMVAVYHNGFAIDPEGYFLVVERAAFSTEYINRKTGDIIKQATVNEV